MQQKNKTEKMFWLVVLHVSLLALIFAVVRIHAATTFDTRIVEAFASMRTPVVTAIMIAATSIGNTFPMILMLLCGVTAFLFTKRNKSLALGLIVAVGGAKATEMLLKLLVERDRPDIHALFHLDTYSFPSGHATAAAALFGYLGLILVSLYPKWQLLLTTAACALIFFVGVSRIYLGVHYPSDVIAGYLVGAIWVLVSVGAVRYART